jgi:putative RecB family exonuclease
MVAMSAAEQLGFDNMPRRLVRATPTRLTGWLDCPRRYRFTYLERPTPQKGPPWAHNSMGAAVHTALAQWWRLPVSRRTPEAAGALLVNGWLTDGFRDREQSERWRELAREMVEDYAAGLDPSDEPIGVERTVALRTPVLALSGRADRIDERLPATHDDDADDDADAWPRSRSAAAAVASSATPAAADSPAHNPAMRGAPGQAATGSASATPGTDTAATGSASATPSADTAGTGSASATPATTAPAGAGEPPPVELVIVDYKTGRHVPTTDDARGSLALAVYAAAAQATLRKPCRRVELHHLPSRTVVSWQHTTQSLTRHLDRANAIGEEVAEAEAAYPNLRGDEVDSVFPPRPGPQCRWCDFAAHCPQGREAYPSRRSWEALATDEPGPVRVGVRETQNG